MKSLLALALVTIIFAGGSVTWMVRDQARMDVELSAECEAGKAVACALLSGD